MVFKHLDTVIEEGALEFEIPATLVFRPNGRNQARVETHVFAQIESAADAIEVDPYFVRFGIELRPEGIEGKAVGIGVAGDYEERAV